MWQKSKKKNSGRKKKIKNEKYIATEFSNNITGMWSPLNMHTDDLFGVFIRSYEEKENVIPSEANFHLALEFSFKHLREHFAFSRY